MGVIIRQSLKNSIVTYFGVIIGTVNVLYLYNAFLSTDQMGLYSAITSFPLVFASFTQLGIPLIAVRFFNRFKDEAKQHNGFFAFLMVAPLAGCLIFSVLYVFGRDLFRWIYQDGSPLLVQYYYYLLPLTICLVYMTVLEAYARVHLRIVVPAIIRELGVKLTNSALAVGYGMHWITFDQLIMALVLVHLLAVFALLGYLQWLGRLYWKVDFSFLRKPIFNEMWQYGLWVLMGGVSVNLAVNIEKFFLPAYSNGMTNTAIFDIAAKIALVIAIPRNALSSISTPLLNESWSRNDMEHIDEIYKKSSLNLLIIGGLLFLGIWCNIDSIFKIIPKSEVYEQGKWVVLFVGLGRVIDMATGLNSEILIGSKYYRYDLAFYIFQTVLLVIANALLIPIYGYNGAALAMLVSLTLYNAIKFWFIYSRFGLQPFTPATIKAVALLVVTYGITQVISIPNDSLGMVFVGIAVKSFVILLVLGGGVLGLRISEDANQTLLGIWRKYRKK
ncbi:oligosaccharide flippase family protein [Runella sp. CRIBMP]|uniref:lipopolysaccharide biosynthesis protein n=1 Tax=Runella sp. CRIBMP TaxID=2683261 RepID=UPI00141347A6|nr:polysaccharide biosynthesis C-terminal domain-containing protein [Runella sp. CRIBMP]NBB22406.1 oligosaccharide flippase family protein [Runella sp. CRIBMP]